MTREQMLFTTVAQKLNQGTQPENGPFRFRGAFFGTFLAKQKSTKNILIIFLSTSLSNGGLNIKEYLQLVFF